KEDSGTWDRLKKMDDQWQIAYKGEPDPETHAASDLNINLRLGLTSFKHVGVFPEQAPNWEFIFSETSRLVRINKANGLPAPKVLNLFAYTGAASLAAKAAGADVTHLDSVRQVVTWARDNMDRSGLDGIRWVVEDAMKFARREARRGNLYQGIILDPPAYGHGPDGEKWKLDELLFDLLKNVAAILAPRDSFMVLNLYSNGYSAMLGETLVHEAFGHDTLFRDISSGELALKDSFGKVLPLSIFVRVKR
ncbi:MAG: class I SAM-dependent methyltransferase, partial [Bacteroidales bacterium]|nr:class I SAM-dependent methyltransferase [Bacteroidales bacterium]